MIARIMGFTRLPGPLSETPPIEPASPSAPVAGLDQPGPVGLEGESNPCEGSPQLVDWPRNINWGEFEKVSARPSGIKEDAQIHAEAIIDSDMNACVRKGKGRLVSFRIRLQVTRASSWVVRGSQTDDLLSHEQGHFDLQGLSARDLMNRLSKLRASDPEELKRLVAAEFKASQKEAQAMSNRYDDETQHGLDIEAQRRWKATIQAAINSGKPI
jgi:hypothetical protein